MRIARSSSPWPRRCARALNDRQHLVVEAGTGVGKSFAYLVPTILATAGAEPPVARRIVISTYTISLQEQLITKDLPLLNAVIPLEFSAVLVKGRHNYLSRRRLRGTVSRAGTLFRDEAEFTDLRNIAKWAESTTDGSLTDLSYRPLPQVWDEAQSDHGNCMGRDCPTYADCFYYQARRRARGANPDRQSRVVFQRPGPAPAGSQYSARLRRRRIRRSAQPRGRGERPPGHGAALGEYRVSR